MNFLLQFCCSMNLIAATRAEEGLVFNSASLSGDPVPCLNMGLPVFLTTLKLHPCQYGLSKLLITSAPKNHCYGHVSILPSFMT